MLSEYAVVYRNILRELRKAAVPPQRANIAVASNIRSIIENCRETKDPAVLQDVQHALLFLRSQRQYKDLLEKYNPLIDLTSQERVKATARRVGLDMPLIRNH